MTLASMTGFSRQSGFSAPYRWAWEIKTVNSKGLDLRLRLPPGFDSLDAPVRAAISKILSRGACYANLTVTRESPSVTARLNRELLAHLMETLAAMPRPSNVGPFTLDGLLGVRGVIETGEAEEDEAALAQAQSEIVAGLGAALTQLQAMRDSEGAALAAVLTQRLDRIETLTKAADASPARQPQAVLERLRQSLAQLCDLGRLDEVAALSGGGAARRQGRYTRGTGPALFPYCRRAKTAGGGRGGRSSAGLFGAGVWTGNQYALRQIQ